MTYNSNDQRTVPAVLQGVTAQNMALTGTTGTVGNSSSVVPAGNPNPADQTPGYLKAAQPGGAEAAVVVQTYGGANLQAVGAPAGTAGGGGLYPSGYQAPATAPVANPMVASGWTAQGNTGDVFAQMAITTASPLPSQAHTSAVSIQLAASGGDGSNTWSLVSGALPSPLTLSAGGLISGTATSAGTSTFTVKVVDTHGNQAEKIFSITLT